MNNVSNDPKDLLVPVKTFCKAFPFHFICDQELSLVQSGEGEFVGALVYLGLESRERKAAS